ncbi:hypothetical protein C8Q78DRAFT_1079184 [Trametes maxima]|nr:hypothetical protein C8Q78DRAFT_1079184 [Trametes maxima]
MVSQPKQTQPHLPNHCPLLRAVYQLSFDDTQKSDTEDVLTWDADIPGSTVKRFRFLNCTEFLEGRRIVIDEVQKHELLDMMAWCTVSYPRSANTRPQESDLAATALPRHAQESTSTSTPPKEYWRWLAVKDPAGPADGGSYHISLAILWEICAAVKAKWPDVNYIWIDRLCTRLGDPEERRWLLTDAFSFLHRRPPRGRGPGMPVPGYQAEAGTAQNPSIVLPAGLGELTPLRKETPYMHCQWTLSEFLMAAESGSPIYVLYEWTEEGRRPHSLPDPDPDPDPGFEAGVQGFLRTQGSPDEHRQGSRVHVVSSRAAVSNLQVILQSFDEGGLFDCKYHLNDTVSSPTGSRAGARRLPDNVSLGTDFLTPAWVPKSPQTELGQADDDAPSTPTPNLKPVRLLLDLMHWLQRRPGAGSDLNRNIGNIFEAVFRRACDDGVVPIAVLVWLLCPYYCCDFASNVFASLDLGRVGTARDTVRGLYVLLHALVANTPHAHGYTPFGWLAAGFMVSELRCPDIPLFPAPPGRQPQSTIWDAQVARAPRSPGGTDRVTPPTKQFGSTDPNPPPIMFRTNYSMDVATNRGDIEIVFSGNAVPLREAAEQQEGECITAYDGSRWVACGENEYAGAYALAVAGVTGGMTAEQPRDSRRALLLKPLCKPTAVADDVPAEGSEPIPASLSSWCDLPRDRVQRWWYPWWNGDVGSLHDFQGSFLVTISDPEPASAHSG